MALIYRKTFEEMCSLLLNASPECGGVLGAKRGQPVSAFYFDESGVSSADSYTPDCEKINAVLEKWEQDGIYMAGIAHSHGNGETMPSCGDLYYCEQILYANPALENFLLPVVSGVNGAVALYVCYLKEGHIRVQQENWQIISDEQK